LIRNAGPGKLYLSGRIRRFPSDIKRDHIMRKPFSSQLFFILILFLLGQPLFSSSVFASWTIDKAPSVSSNWQLLNLRFFWAVGQDSENKTGVLLYFTNGSWTTVTPPHVSSDWGLSGINFFSTSEGWTVGQNFENHTAALLHFSDVPWKSEASPAISSDWGLFDIEYISSSEGWAVGQDFENKRGVVLFFSTTPAALPTLTTAAVSNITNTTADSGGTITSDGGLEITARGVCWGTSVNPAVGSNCTSDGTGKGSFTSAITGLTANTPYHVRAFATNSLGTGYGNDLTFVTLISNLPTVITSPISSITATTAFSGGTVTSAGGSVLTAEGVCWNKTGNPGLTDQCTDDGTDVGTFVSTLTGLTPNTPYHVRAYATNLAGTSFGNDLTFVTAAALMSTQGLTPEAVSTAADTAAAPGSTTWIAFTLPDVSSDWGLSAIRFTWAVGQDFENKRGVLLHFSNASWASIDPPGVSSDWGLSAIGFISPDEGWAVGQDSENKRGVLLHLSNGSWTSETPPSVSSDWGLSGIGFISAKEGWAVGQDFENKKGVLLHFSNGSWTSVEPPDVGADWSLSAVHFSSFNIGWAVGQSSDGTNTEGVLLRYAVAQISVSPANINFHDVEIGAVLDQIVTVKNNGNGALILGTITPPSPPFSIKTDDCSGKSIPPLTTCKVIYEFGPESGGIFAGSSNIPSNTFSETPITVTLAGSGIPETSNSIDLLSPPDGETFAACPDLNPPVFQWNPSGSFKSIELQFSPNGDFSGIPLKVRSNPSASQITIPSSVWRKVLLLPGDSGGKVYWRTVGQKQNNSKVESNIFSFEVQGAEAVSDPQISHTSKTTLPPPDLSWDNNCNIKFKVWFGNDPDFKKSEVRKTALSFSTKDPNANQGIFTGELTSGQWSSIRKLVGNQTGSAIYWFVESSDVLGRKRSTEVMSFLLTD
jgi:hypothetical protein